MIQTFLRNDKRDSSFSSRNNFLFQAHQKNSICITLENDTQIFIFLSLRLNPFNSLWILKEEKKQDSRNKSRVWIFSLFQKKVNGLEKRMRMFGESCNEYGTDA